MSILADTGYVYALYYPDDACHQQAMAERLRHEILRRLTVQNQIGCSILGELFNGKIGVT